MVFAETVFSGAEHPGTKLEVLDSAAGFYVGYRDKDGSPYTRETKYFDVQGEADQALAVLNELLAFGFNVRDCEFVR